MWIPPPVAKEKYETPRRIGFLIPNTPEVGELGLPFSLGEGGARCGNWTGDDNPSDCLTKGMGAPNVKGTNQKAELFNRHAKFCLGYRSI